MLSVRFAVFAKKDSTRSLRMFFLKLSIAIRFCKLLKINLKNSRPYHLQSQGKMERSHRTGKRKLEFDMKQENSKTMVI